MVEMTTTSAICARCPVALTDDALTGQAVALLGPVRIRHIGPTRRARGEALVVMRGVFEALPECRGLCFHCAIECAETPDFTATHCGRVPRDSWASTPRTNEGRPLAG